MKERVQYRDILKEYQDETFGTTIEERIKNGTITRTIAQIVNDAEKEPKPEHGQWWGWWQYDNDNTLTLYQEGCKTHIYYVKLEKVKTSEDIMKWIFHMAAKSWVTPDIVGNLFFALIDIKKEEIKELIV